ncbi:50S ribosomal protein L29 [Thermodesulfovibrionales bacterium]|nr:50S ribosomal protein L29 [Thermodesulfovibrionales bacterium]MCL0037403.1 50S ribosomal protein L29 [Thermodesulfovibrionales bacterium]MCL0049808.1 50S ribosomal protein L29 [Thermodesulfovibrionales bacterium]MCL0062072.1 50S ribosomal protein L29 [Thermodesulfovibrionales bacterium]MCL0068990.1 50S ribosomal protein L29 [Thermodesulfovibrionales bacterium]
MKSLKHKASSKLKDLSVDELRQKEMDLRRELFNLRFQIAKAELVNNIRVRHVRKDIARVLTMITVKDGG